MEPKQRNFVRLFIIILSVKLLHRRESFRKKIFIPSLAVTEENTNKDNKKQEIKFGPGPAGHQMKSMGNGINYKPTGEEESGNEEGTPFSCTHAHLAVGRQKTMVEGGTRMSMKMGRYPTGRGGALCSRRSITAALTSLETSPRMSSSTDTCSSLRNPEKWNKRWDGIQTQVNLQTPSAFLWGWDDLCPELHRRSWTGQEDYLMSGYLDARPDTSRVSMPGSLRRMKSARTGSKARGFASSTGPSSSLKTKVWLMKRSFIKDPLQRDFGVFFRCGIFLKMGTYLSF